MTCYGCRDLSSIIEPSPSTASGTSKRVNNGHNDKDKGKRTLKPTKRLSKMEKVHDAKKKDIYRKKASNTRPIINYVFVGNLEPTVTRDELKLHFRLCGPVARVEIRCSRGQAVNVGIPDGCVSPRDRKYATIEFRDPSSVEAALKKNGSLMGKQQTKIVVCSSAADLPEVAEIVSNRIDKLQGPKPVHPMNRMRRYLAHQPTEPDLSIPKNDKFRIWGFSFAKTII